VMACRISERGKPSGTQFGKETPVIDVSVSKNKPENALPSPELEDIFDC